MLLVQFLVFALYLLALGLRLRHALVNAAWPSGLGGRGPTPSQRFALLAFQLLALKRKARVRLSPLLSGCAHHVPTPFLTVLIRGLTPTCQSHVTGSRLCALELYAFGGANLGGPVHACEVRLHARLCMRGSGVGGELCPPLSGELRAP